MKIEIINGVTPAKVRTLSPKKAIEILHPHLTAGIAEYIYSLKEVNIFLEDYKLDFRIYKHGLWWNCSVKVPKGAISDGSSVPRIGKAIVNDDYHNGAWEAHDSGYKSKGRDISINGYEIPSLTRKEWDLLFKVITLKNGATKAGAKLAYTTLRLGGWKMWGSKGSKNRFSVIDTKSLNP